MGAQKIVDVEESESGVFRVRVRRVVHGAVDIVGVTGGFVGGDFATRDEAELAAAAMRSPTPSPSPEQLAIEADAWRELAAAHESRMPARIERARTQARELGLHAFLAPATERIRGGE